MCCAGGSAEAKQVTVRIGHETASEQMVGTSMVSTAYGTAHTAHGRYGCRPHPDGLSKPLPAWLRLFRRAR